MKNVKLLQEGEQEAVDAFQVAMDLLDSNNLVRGVAEYDVL